MKKKNKQNLLPKELQQFEILTDNKLQTVIGGSQKGVYTSQRSFVPSWFRKIFRN